MSAMGRFLPVATLLSDRLFLGESRHSLAAPLSLWSAISNVAYGSRLCEKSKRRRIWGYFDPYLIVDRRLHGILRGRILKTEVENDFSHTLGQYLSFATALRLLQSGRWKFAAADIVRHIYLVGFERVCVTG